MDASINQSRFWRRKPAVLALLALFLLPIAARAAMFWLGDHPRSFRDADWSSIGSLPPASQYPQARLLVLSGRTGGWKGVLAVHSWIVIKRENATRWTRFDVVGWGDPIRVNGWAPDGRWFGDRPSVVVDVSGAEAQTLIPKVEAAVKDYRFAHAGDYRIWPGPNSNTFVATVMRAVPEIATSLPANAIGRDFRPGPYLGTTDSGTGLEANLWGLLGIKVGWVEGVEVNFLGLVAGLDFRHPGVKLPGFGRLGVDSLVPAALAR
ncbi:MAG: hypothetical protein QOF19_2320 [Alphaproteobacteria bacterium]|jgi:hypothetical protein|nr:hypothetical protein [Alphaproteobacteria bacterium]